MSSESSDEDNNHSSVFAKDAFPRLGNSKKNMIVKKRPSYSEAVRTFSNGEGDNRSQLPAIRYNRSRPRNIDFSSFVPRRINGETVRDLATKDAREDSSRGDNSRGDSSRGDNSRNFSMRELPMRELPPREEFARDIRETPLKSPVPGSRPDLISYNMIRESRIAPAYKIDGQYSALTPADRGAARKYRPKQAPKVRNSVGVALFRRHENRIQILLVRKRSTYAFHTFVHSQYKSDDTDAIMALFNKMTAEEKLDILSMNFNQIWYRIWLNTPFRTAFYYMCKHKFENTFLRDGGKNLRAMIARSTCGNLIWEIPKGRRSRGESTLDCAIREFQEETNISKEQYRVVFMPDRGAGPTRSFTHQDEGTVYTNVYYMAVENAPIKINIDFHNESQIVEIGELRWMDISDIAKVDWNGLLMPFIRPLMRYMRKHV